MGSEPSRGVSFRFQPRLIERLRMHAHETGESQTALAARYLEEGMRLDEHPGIYFRDAGSGRRPALLGTHLDVAQIVETLRQNESSVEETAEYLDISPASIEIVVRYYASYGDEVDEWIEQSRAIAERERELWRRRQQLLAR